MEGNGNLPVDGQKLNNLGVTDEDSGMNHFVIHPCNHDLFPNLVGVAEHYRQYKFNRLHLATAADSSAMTNGTYLFSVLPHDG